MNAGSPRILVVDDEPLNVMLISEYLGGGDYRLEFAGDGVEAWERLCQRPAEYDLVLLDRMMPGIDGMEVLRRIKADSRLQVLPVILQTALDAPEDIRQGVRAGAYYYLAKPFERDMLQSVVAAAVRDHRRYRRMQERIERAHRLLGLVRRAEFTIHTLEQARDLAGLLASACPRPQKIVVGLGELLVNAVEHGNLAIGYREKGSLLEQGRLDREIAVRLQDPAYRDRRVEVVYQRGEREITIRIKDQGEGFDWRAYQQVPPERVFDPHGRGITVARIMSFDRVEYLGCGNEVVAAIDL